VFSGTTTPKLDEKGRLVIPSKFRELSDGALYITKGQDRCLSIYTASEFSRIAEQLQGARVTTKSAREFVRNFMASAELQVPDRQGRISVPNHLRLYAALERDLVVIGNNNKVEIWSVELWESNQAEQDELFANRDEEVIPGIF
jgi:MraZ protein